MSTIPSSPSLHQPLLSRLVSLPFPAFVEVARQLLTTLGYEEVRPVVTRNGKKGKNRSGGFDLEGWVKVGTGRRRIIAQVKQLAPDAKVYQRTLDELRGAALRTGATEALLLTTGMFSSIVEEHLARQRWGASTGTGPLVPVQCLDGNQFAERLLTHEIGITRENSNTRLDEAYFARLVAESAKSRRIVSLPKAEGYTGKPIAVPSDTRGKGSAGSPVVMNPSALPKCEEPHALQSRKPGDPPMRLQLSLHLWLFLPTQPESE